MQKSVVVPESQKTVKVPFKVFRGMASLQAIVDRLDVEDADAARSRRSAPKAWRSACPRAARCGPIVRDMLKHLCSAISYGGAASLPELREKFRQDPERYVIRLTESSRRESFDR